MKADIRAGPAGRKAIRGKEAFRAGTANLTVQLEATIVNQPGQRS